MRKFKLNRYHSSSRCLPSIILLDNTEPIQARVLFSVVQISLALLMTMMFVLGFIVGILVPTYFLRKTPGKRSRDRGRADKPVELLQKKGMSGDPGRWYNVRFGNPGSASQEMIEFTSSHSHLFAWVILPILIFLSRIADVSIGTVRVILVSRRLKYLAPVAGFFEVLIWIVVIGQIMKNLSSPACYVAYAGGFAMGNFIGILIAEKLSIGMVLVRVIFPKQANGLLDRLRERRYGVTSMDGQAPAGRCRSFSRSCPRARSRALSISSRYPIPRRSTPSRRSITWKRGLSPAPALA